MEQQVIFQKIVAEYKNNVIYSRRHDNLKKEYTEKALQRIRSLYGPKYAEFLILYFDKDSNKIIIKNTGDGRTTI